MSNLLAKVPAVHLTRVKGDAGPFAAVAAFCGSHQCSRVCPATVESKSAGGVAGGTGRHVAVLPCHLNGVETCSTALRPGEIPFVRATVHVTGEVSWLTRD